MTDHEWLTCDNACAYISVDRSQLEELIAAKRLRSYQCDFDPTFVRFRRADLDRLLGVSDHKKDFLRASYPYLNEDELDRVFIAKGGCAVLPMTIKELANHRFIRVGESNLRKEMRKRPKALRPLNEGIKGVLRLNFFSVAHYFNRVS